MKSKKVLIVENNDFNRKLFENLIGQIWYFESVKDGLTAVEKACEEQFDLILMDIQMPEMDGIATAKLIWKQSKHQCPIIAISTYAAESARSCFLELGFVDFISKPIRPKEFLEVISGKIESENSEADVKEEEPHTLDMHVFQQLKKFNSVEVIKSLYADFLEEFDQLICQIDSAFKEVDKKVIVDNLHTIKGNSGSLGAKTIFNLSTNADISARAQDWDSLEIALKKLKNEREIFEKYLKEETTFNP